MQIARVLFNDVPTYAEYKDGKYYLISGDIYGEFSVGKQIEVSSLLCPVVPTKVVALGVNYAKHREEMRHDPNMLPVIFQKPVSALLAPEGNIVYPTLASTVHYEAELVIVIGKRVRKASKADAGKYIFGYTCANDVSERNFQKIDGQWTRAKGYDTFCPVGSYITTDIDPTNLTVQTVLNGTVVQDGNTADLIRNVYDIVEFVSSIMTLEVGDIILTGTPQGVGEIHVGDTVTIQISSLGSITNRVIAE
ncbi:MAG: fumarylacetoacetate hydrolase family protein [Clostridia bacterium]